MAHNVDRIAPASPSAAARTEAFPRASVPVLHYRGGSSALEVRGAICESELSVAVNGRQLVNLLCSRASLRELAFGFLLDEGVISSLEDVRAFELDEDNLRASFELRLPFENTGCATVSSGFGGKVLRSPLAEPVPARGCSDADELGGGGEGRQTGTNRQDAGRRPGGRGACPPADEVLEGIIAAMGTMQSNAPEHAATRGMHCSALFGGGGMIGCFEDIGRHNTFDKLAGHCLLNAIPTQGTLLTTTGRVSAEMMRKALRLGVEAVASCSGPTDVAIRLARDAGVMLVGYAGRGEEALVYAPGTGMAWACGADAMPPHACNAG